MLAGSEIRLTVRGSPDTERSSVFAATNLNLIIGLALLGVVLILSGGWLYLRNRPTPAVGVDAIPAAKRSPENPETLMDAILALDDLYKDGQLPEDAYLKRRAELKRRLKEKMSA
jgi:hypothetical protein